MSQALASTVFSFGDLKCENGGSVVVDDHSFGLRSANVSWCPAATFGDFKSNLLASATAMGLKPAQLQLVVVARSGYLKHTEVVYKISLSGLGELKRDVTITNSPDGIRRRVFRAATHTVFIDAYVLLDTTLEKEPLRPSRLGTWLAHSRFRIECDSQESLFKPMPLNRTERERLRLEPETVHFVELDACDLTEPTSETNLPVLWVDEDILTAMDLQRSSPLGRQFQRQLAQIAIGAIVSEFARRSSDTGHEVPQELAHASYEDVRDSLVGRIARLVAGSTSSTSRCNEALQMCRKEPARAVAWIEDRIGLMDSLRGSMKGEPE